MTTAEIELLVPQWGADPARPILADPWDRPSDSFGQQRAVSASIRDRPDFGWALAGRLVRSRRNCALLKRPAYRWIQCAVALLSGGASASRRLKDVAMVALARDIHESDALRPIMNAALITRNATTQSVADALNLPSSAVEAYQCLFFNVLDRRDDLAYVRKIVGGGKVASRIFAVKAAPSDDEVLLAAGFDGSIDDILMQAGCGGGAGEQSVSALADRLLRNTLVAGAKWTGSPMALKQAPPAMVSHAFDFAKKAYAEPTEVTDVHQSGGIGSFLRDQLEQDAATIRDGLARTVDFEIHHHQRTDGNAA